MAKVVILDVPPMDDVALHDFLMSIKRAIEELQGK